MAENGNTGGGTSDPPGPPPGPSAAEGPTWERIADALERIADALEVLVNDDDD